MSRVGMTSERRSTSAGAAGSSMKRELNETFLAMQFTTQHVLH